MSAPTVKNWFGGITSNPSTVVEVRTVEEIVAIVTDTERYPSPVRAVGSNHSTTGCGTADDGTLIVTRKMDRILDIGTDTVTAQAGALYIDVNEELRKHGLQFFVNVELGNLTIGSACCGGTKDASMAGEFGQIASYAVGIKMVLPNGELFEVDESDPELLQVARSSYGLFGIVYEATFRVRKLAAMQVHHEEVLLPGVRRPAARAPCPRRVDHAVHQPVQGLDHRRVPALPRDRLGHGPEHLAVEAAQLRLEPPRAVVGLPRLAPGVVGPACGRP